MNIKHYMDSYLSKDISDFYERPENASRLSPLQKAVVIFNSPLSMEEKNRGYLALIAEGKDDVINDLSLHIPVFAMHRSVGVVKEDFPDAYKRGQSVFDYGNGEVVDIEKRARIFKGWSSLFTYLALYMDGKLGDTKRVGLERIPLNLFLKNSDGTTDFVWENGEMLECEAFKLVVYAFSSYPNGSVRYDGIKVLPNGHCISYMKDYSKLYNSFYGDDDIYHASRINRSSLVGNEIIMLAISIYVSKNPQTDSNSLCNLLDSVTELNGKAVYAYFQSFL